MKYGENKVLIEEIINSLREYKFQFAKTKFNQTWVMRPWSTAKAMKKLIQSTNNALGLRYPPSDCSEGNIHPLWTWHGSSEHKGGGTSSSWMKQGSLKREQGGGTCNINNWNQQRHKSITLRTDPQKQTNNSTRLVSTFWTQ